MSDDIMGDAVYTIVNLIFISLAVAITILLINSYTIKDINNHAVELQTLIEGTMQSTFAMVDPITNQPIPGMVDMQKFKDTNLSQHIVWEKPGATIKYDLFIDGNRIATNYYVSHSQLDERAYQRAVQRMDAGNRFIQLYTRANPKIRPITIYDNGTYKHGEMRIAAAQEI